MRLSTSVLTALPLLLASLVGLSAGNTSVSISTQGRLVTSEKTLAAEWSYIDCGLPTDAILLQSLSISPDPPVPGKDLTITVQGRVTQRIEDGAYADVTVKIGRIKLLQKTFDVCEEALKANASVTCPVEEGEYKVEQTVALPKEIPPAPFTIAVRGYTVDDDDMVCLDLMVDFRKK
ncbi:ML domain-containing protein [Mycena polygramma]|nr:ML domain-containing protein [Mycena polygramma]